MDNSDIGVKVVFSSVVKVNKSKSRLTLITVDKLTVEALLLVH